MLARSPSGGWAAALWARWRMCVWVLLVPHMLLFPFIGALEPVYLSEELGASAADLGLVESAKHWLTVLGSPVLGWLMRRYGLKVIVGLHMVCFVGGAALMASLSSWEGALLVGALQGFELSSVTIARAYFLLTQLPPTMRPAAAVAVGVSNKINYIIAPAIGSLVFQTSGGSYRAIYWAQAAFGFIPIFLLVVFVPHKLGAHWEVEHALVAEHESVLSRDLNTPGKRFYTEICASRYALLCRQYFCEVLIVVGWSVMFQTCQVAWSTFVMPLRLREAGIDSGTINFLKAAQYCASFPLLLLTGYIMDHSRDGVRICSACFGGFYGIGLICFSLAGPQLWQFCLATLPYAIAEGFGPSPAVLWALMAPPSMGAEFFSVVYALGAVASIITPYCMGLLAEATSLATLGCVVGAVGVSSFWYCWYLFPENPITTEAGQPKAPSEGRISVQPADKHQPIREAAQEPSEAEALLIR